MPPASTAHQPPVSPPPAPVAHSAPAPPRAPSLRALAIRGSAWTVAGFGAGQVIRLGANLITTRLLLPEHFGLMALVGVWIAALEMFSDLGVNAAVIQSPRGDERRFLDTAFTIQAVRGVVLWLGVCALAWPVSLLYGEPMLAQLLPVAGFTAVLFGLTGMSLATHGRHMALGRLNVLELGSIVAQVIAAVVLALLWRSVWALVVAGLIGAAVKLVASHTVLRVHAARFRWDGEAARSLVRFGRWILVSSMLGFLVNRGDVLIMGRLMPIELLGIFFVASQFAQVIRQLYFRLANSVIYPLHVKIGAEPGPALRAKVAHVRLGVMALMLPPLWGLAVLGPELIGWLYDDRYADAGQMLRLLAFAGIFTIVPDVGPIQLARGESLLFMISLVVRSALLFGCMLAGHAIAGVWGLIAGISASAALFYPWQAWICQRYGVWIPRLDALGFGTSALVIGGGIFLLG